MPQKQLADTNYTKKSSKNIHTKSHGFTARRMLRSMISEADPGDQQLSGLNEM